MKQTNKHSANQTNAAALSLDQVATRDLKNAVLVVSVLLNAVLLIGFMIVQSTSAYDHQVISLLLTN